MSGYGYASIQNHDIQDLEDTVIALSDEVDIFSTYIQNISSSNANKLSLTGGQMLGPVDMQGYKITGNYVPSTSFDLSNKLYVDNGDTACRAYTDTVGATKLDKTGGSISSNLSVGGSLTVSTNLTVAGNLTVSGAITSSGSTIVNCFISSSGQATAVSNTTTILYISSGFNNLIVIPYSGTLNNWQEVTLFNATPAIVTLGHNASTSNGSLNCLYFSLYPNRSVKLLFDSNNSRWVLQQIPSDFLFQFKFFKWINDNGLNLFLNSNLSYQVKINFYNSNTTVNGVSGIEYVTNSTSGTNWQWTVYDTSSTGYTTTNSFNLSGTESNKLSGFIYGFTSNEFTVKNLVIGNYYMLQVYHMVYDSTNRSMKIIHKNALGDTINTLGYHTQYYSVGTASANGPGQIMTYIFRADLQSSEIFTFSNTNNGHIYAIFVQILGPNL